MTSSQPTEGLFQVNTQLTPRFLSPLIPVKEPAPSLVPSSAPGPCIEPWGERSLFDFLAAAAAAELDRVTSSVEPEPEIGLSTPPLHCDSSAVMSPLSDPQSVESSRSSNRNEMFERCF